MFWPQKDPTDKIKISSSLRNDNTVWDINFLYFIYDSSICLSQKDWS